jgi:hypothetical protein
MEATPGSCRHCYQAVLYPEDDDFLVDRDDFVLHFEVLEGPS